MKILSPPSLDLAAPCGMICFACYAFLRKKKACPGCRGADPAKPGHCRECKIKTCAAEHTLDFCFQCPAFPCQIIKRMDKSYRLRYSVSLVGMAERLKSIGPTQFLIEEMEKWRCPDCDGIVSLHDRTCSECGAASLDTPPGLC